MFWVGQRLCTNMPQSLLTWKPKHGRGRIERKNWKCVWGRCVAVSGLEWNASADVSNYSRRAFSIFYHILIIRLQWLQHKSQSEIIQNQISVVTINVRIPEQHVRTFSASANLRKLNFLIYRSKLKTGGIIAVKETPNELSKRESRQRRFQSSASASPPLRNVASVKRPSPVSTGIFSMFAWNEW